MHGQHQRTYRGRVALVQQVHEDPCTYHAVISCRNVWKVFGDRPERLLLSPATTLEALRASFDAVFLGIGLSGGKRRRGGCQAQHQQTQRIFRVVMSAIAGVSLLVGGIGIMNIMLANVLERRREVGLLRALGARKADVVAQFLREAAVICVAGALLGVAFGVALAYGIAALAGTVIHGNTGQASVPREQRRILWLAKRVDDSLLRDVALRFQQPVSPSRVAISSIWLATRSNTASTKPKPAPSRERKATRKVRPWPRLDCIRLP